jgi:hypothetical protein
MSEPHPHLAIRIQGARRELAAAGLCDPAVQHCLAGLDSVEAYASRLPRLAVLGEGNSGKTSLINALIGAELLPTSALANTCRPLLVRYGPLPRVTAIGEDGRRIDLAAGAERLGVARLQHIDVELPAALLRRFEIVDTPARDVDSPLVRDADMVVWCTLATRAWTAAEQRTWCEAAPRLHRRALLVATNADRLAPEETRRVEGRLQREAIDGFRQVALTSPRGGHQAALDALTATLDAMSSEIRSRRERLAAKMARRLVRLTLDHLVTLPEGEAAGWPGGERAPLIALSTTPSAASAPERAVPAWLAARQLGNLAGLLG